MEILINGKQAFLKKNTSFEYISENSMFTGSDSYTLTITFPLKDCPQNIAIFGHINRQDVKKEKVVFNCDIRDKAFFKSGSITVTQISEAEVKTQFLEGRSEQNFDDTFDNIYINQLHLGYPSYTETSISHTTPAEAWKKYPLKNWVALPWVNNTSGNIQNEVAIDGSGNYCWSNQYQHLTYQPYLLYILNMVCQAVEYTGDFSALEKSTFRYMLICNTLPHAWGIQDFATALPHWSLTEFFEQLELLLDGEFIINHKAKTINFKFLHNIMAEMPPVHIRKVVNKYSVDVSKDNKSEYKGATNLMYADNDNRMWVYKSCQWYINEHKDEALVFTTLDELLSYAATLKECGVQHNENHHGVSYTRGYESNSDGNKLFYAEDVDTYFIMYCYKSTLYDSLHVDSLDQDFNYYIYTNRLMPINEFGKLVVDKEAEDVELNIVPAWIDYTDEEHGNCLFLECGEMSSDATWTENNGSWSGVFSGGGFGGSDGYSSGSGDTDYNNGELVQSETGMKIARGEQEQADEYFDKIYVAFWDGQNRHQGMMPYPSVDSIEIDDNFHAEYTPFSLRLNKENGEDEQGNSLKYTFKIDNRKKYSFSFLADEIPDPRAVFFIEGGRYVCEKITATFHENTGKSQLLKGVFYLITE